MPEVISEKCANCKVNDIDYDFYNKDPDYKGGKHKFCSTSCTFSYWEKLRRHIREEYKKRGK